MPRPSRRILVAVQLLVAAAVLTFVALRLGDQWAQVRPRIAGLSPRWTLVVASSLLVLATYALLVETWRRMLHAWGFDLPRGEAARIWFVSNLGRYVPGKVWQIGAMGVMAQRAGVSAVAATGSAILVNLVSILAGAGVVVATGASALLPRGSVPGILVVTAAIALVPGALPYLARLAQRITGRAIAIPPLPARAIWIAAAGSTIAWVAYGIAFRLLAEGILPSGPAGHPSAWIAAFTFSYLVGYLFLPAPGGLVVRETALVAALVQLQVVGEADAIILAVVSRLWLTVLEVLPGALLLARGLARPTITDRPT